MNDSSQQTLKRIEEQLDDALIQRLALHAAQKIERRWWQGVLGGEAPSGMKAMDFVQQAVEKTLMAAQGFENGRKWDYASLPDLFLHLRSVIDSDINHLVEGWENREFRSEAALTKTTNEGEQLEVLPTIPTEGATPLQSCIESEEERAREMVLFEFFDLLADDPELQKVMELIFDGVTKPADQAKRLSLSSKEMYVVTRRMRRRIEKFKLEKAKVLSEARTHA